MFYIRLALNSSILFMRKTQGWTVGQTIHRWNRNIILVCKQHWYCTTHNLSKRLDLPEKLYSIAMTRRKFNWQKLNVTAPIAKNGWKALVRYWLQQSPYVPVVAFQTSSIFGLVKRQWKYFTELNECNSSQTRKPLSRTETSIEEYWQHQKETCFTVDKVVKLAAPSTFEEAQ